MTPYYEHGGIQIFHADCLDVLPQIGAVDHVITDPPYSDHVHSKSMRGADGWKGQIAETRELGFDSLSRDVLVSVADWCAHFVPRWSLAFSDVESAHYWREAFETGKN